MFKKFNSITLLVILAVLIGVYFAVEYGGSKKKSKSLRTELVQIDTAKVSKLKIEMKGIVVDLFKDGNDWKLNLDGGKTVEATETSVKASLNALLTIKPSRMATRKESKWAEYEVDSTGTHVTVFEGSDKTLDIVLGKFAVQGRESYHSFVRLFEDTEVYVANNFMNFSVPSDPVNYRNQELLNLEDTDSLVAVSFTYPGDSSIQLSNNAGVWSANGQLADSVSITEFLSDIKFVNSKEFVDENDDLTIPILTARLAFSNRDDIIIEAYQKEQRWIIHSSENEKAYFRDVELVDKIFKGQSTFLK